MLVRAVAGAHAPQDELQPKQASPVGPEEEPGRKGRPTCGGGSAAQSPP